MTTDDLILDGTPVLIAREFMKRVMKTPLRFWRGDFYHYNGTHYDSLDRITVDAEVNRFMCSAKTHDKKGNLKLFVSNKKIVDEVRSQLMWDRNVLVESHKEERTKISDGSSINHLIPFPNGLLDIDTGELHEHSPDNLSFNCLSFNHDPDAPEPVEWLKFLNSCFPDDKDDEIGGLEEIIGYLLSGDTSMEKIFLFLGPKRCGKGTLYKLLIRMIGEAYVGGMSIQDFNETFGMQEMIGKTLCVMPDERTHYGLDPSAASHLLAISGRDKIKVKRKYMISWEGVLSARVLILSNEIPAIPDSAGVLPTRFVPKLFEISFYDREDPQLFNKLERELPAIMNRCIVALKRLRDRGHFIITPKAQEKLNELMAISSPVTVFFNDELVADPNGVAMCGDTYEKYKEWCDAGRHKPCTRISFFQKLSNHYKEHGVAIEKRRQPNGAREWFYAGVRFHDHADDYDKGDPIGHHMERTYQHLVRDPDRKQAGLDPLYEPINRKE